MNKGFWEKLPRPFFVLAPMANVTDAAFRRLVACHAKPDVLWTEFVSARGLTSPGREHLLPDLLFEEKERPIVAQFFGSRPQDFEAVARLSVELKFDGIDINMGCPDKGVEKQGAGAALMKTPELAKELILATKKAAGPLPVSVKTRLGYQKNEIKTWLPHLLEAEPAAITFHLRTRKEMSKVPAHWEALEEIMEIVDRSTSKENRPLIIGNGDSLSLEEGREKAKQYGIDGIMIGRGIFHNFWIFDQEQKERTFEEKMEVLLEHLNYFEMLFKDKKSFNLFKKFLKVYVNGFDDVKELRAELMSTANPAEMKQRIEEALRRYK